MAKTSDGLLRLEQASWLETDAGPILRVRVDGTWLEKGLEWKPTLRANGIMALGTAFVDRLPPIEFNVPGQRRKITLQGCTRDRRLVALYRQFWEACNRVNGQTFHVGPVAIPE